MTSATSRLGATLVASVGIIAALTTTASAAPAQPAENHYLQFTNHAAYVAQTCYHWLPTGVAGDYCHTNRRNGQTWRAYIPAQATSVEVSFDYAGGKYHQFDNRTLSNDRNWCYTLLGATQNAYASGSGCPS
ncbi:hypothetical protein ACIA49_33515 [Kribbella sp. NPDC051587]|uniref:hypothetical protein n=1 Tax=Kribbella sp. NPDC051587 TaxID=3364119 RepID=UPI0037A17CBB